MLDLELLAQNQHQSELIKQAEQDRLAQEILADGTAYIPSLAWLGERMLDLGKGLIALSGRRDDSFSKN
ncbi:MAG: hypothetical protein SGI73_21350 [Chloroflexota bacterium]|nr:hypothetical protein [Chloroflexota bacterium]